MLRQISEATKGPNSETKRQHKTDERKHLRASSTFHCFQKQHQRMRGEKKVREIITRENIYSKSKKKI